MLRSQEFKKPRIREELTNKESGVAGVQELQNGTAAFVREEIKSATLDSTLVSVPGHRHLPPELLTS
jgi:hypothetical protein